MPRKTLAARPATRRETGSGLSELRNKSILMSDPKSGPVPKSVRGAAAPVNQEIHGLWPRAEQQLEAAPHSAGFDELLG